MMKMRTLNKYHAFGRIGDGFEMAFTFSLSIYVYLFILKEIAMGPWKHTSVFVKSNQ